MMKLFCSKCRAFFDDADIVVSVDFKNLDPKFRYYHDKCTPKGAKSAIKKEAWEIISDLDGTKRKPYSTNGGVVYHRECRYCGEEFKTNKKYVFYCNREHYRLANKLKAVKNMRALRANRKKRGGQN